MTTPPPPPATTTGSFQSVLWPADVANILNLLVGGSPFASALTRYPTGRHEVAFPVAAPDRPAWLAEMADIPVIGLGDAADVVGTCKLASIVLTSNEAWADTDHNLTQEFTQLLKDSASAELDRGLLYGTGSPEPRGVVAAAPPAAGSDLAAALTTAVGSIGDSGGSATTVAARPSVLANARNTKDSTGQLVYPGGIGSAYGLAEVGVPELAAADILVLDASRVFLIIRNDFKVDLSQDYAFRQDAVAIRLRGRFAVACPQLQKGLRKLVIGTVQQASTGKH